MRAMTIATLMVCTLLSACVDQEPLASWVNIQMTHCGAQHARGAYDVATETFECWKQPPVGEPSLLYSRRPGRAPLTGDWKGGL